MTDWIAALLALAREDEGDGEVPALSLGLLTTAPTIAGAELELAAEEQLPEMGPWALPSGEPMAGADRTALAMPGAVQRLAAGMALPGQRQSAEALSAMGQVYRRAVEAVSPAAMTASARQWPTAENTADEPLTAEDFDRLICRDSRRYDGGMSIY